MLTHDHGIGRQVRDPYSGVGRVDALTALPPRTEYIDAQIGWVDHDFVVVVDFGRHEDAGKGGVPAGV